VARNLCVATGAALIAPFIPRQTARAILADPRTIIFWGSPDEYKARAARGHQQGENISQSARIAGAASSPRG